MTAGSGEARGPGRAAEAAGRALRSLDLEGVLSLTMDVFGEVDLFEPDEAAEVVTGLTDPNADLAFRVFSDASLGNTVRVAITVGREPGSNTAGGGEPAGPSGPQGGDGHVPPFLRDGRGN